MAIALPALYPILNVRGEENVDERVRFASELARAGATIIQLRAKEMAAGALLDCARALVTELAAHDCRLIVNDRADVAAAAGAAGVHLGDDDLPVRAARALLGPAAIIGFSTHSPEEAAAAPRELLDYLGFGPVYDSPTKAGVRSPRGIAMLREACRRTELPVVAIGGVRTDRAAEAFAAGATACAVIGELTADVNPRGLVAAYESLRRSSGPPA